MKSTLIGLRWYLPLFVCLFFTVPSLAQEKKLTPREQLLARVGEKVEVRFDQPYAGNTNPKQMVDLYLPKKRNSDKPLPVSVYIHGGGWSGGDRAGYYGAASKIVSSGDYAAVGVGYRLSGEAKWPAQIYDCKAAIRWIRGHAKEFNLDPDRICVQGGSAGGHLVTMLGVTEGVKELEGDIGEFTNLSSRVTCVVNFCGPSDLTEPLMQGEQAKTDDPVVVALIGGNLKDKMDVAKAASPLTYITKGAAPILTVHGSKDMRVNYNNATKLDAALQKAGASTLLLEVTDGGHGINGGAEMDKRVQQFIDLHLRDIKTEISMAPIPTQAPPPPAKK
jgi:acetyl esterase/lipase